MKGPLFYAKILLFGEYGIIKDSKGLAIPYSHYQGALKIADETNASQKKSNKNLFKFHAYSPPWRRICCSSTSPLLLRTYPKVCSLIRVFPRDMGSEVQVPW